MKTKTEPYRPVHSGNLQSTKSEDVRASLHVDKPADQEPYFVDELAYQNNCKFYSELLEYFKKIAAEYPTLEIGELSPGVLQQIANNDYSEIEKRVKENIEASLKATGVTNSTVLSNLRKGTDQPFAWFKIHTNLALLEIGRIRGAHPQIIFTPAVFSIQGGAINFTDTDKSRLKNEYCTIRIDTPEKKHFAELAQTTLENLQKLKGSLLKNNVSNIFGSECLFQESGDNILMGKEILKFIKK